MIRNRKVLGLALAALSALAAVSASGALAGELTTANGEAVTLTATQTGATLNNSFTAFGGSLHCPGSTMTGHQLAITPHQLVPNKATSVTLIPFYKNCTLHDSSGSIFPVTIDMNGCDYQIESGVTGNGEGEYIGTGAVVCPAGAKVQMTVFSSSSHALRICTISTSNLVTAGAKVTSTLVGGDIDITGTLIGFVSEKSGLCGAATDSNGILHIDATVNAINKAGVPVSISISD